MPVPVVTSITPDRGPIQGGTDVTITGTGLRGTTSVRFGGVEAARFTVNSDTSITATTALGMAVGSCSVDVTHAGGNSQANSLYTYVRNTFDVNMLELYSTFDYFFLNTKNSNMDIVIVLADHIQ